MKEKREGNAMRKKPDEDARIRRKHVKRHFGGYRLLFY